MRWFARRRSDDAVEPLNIDAVVAAGMRDKTAARQAIVALDRERARVLRTQRVLVKQSSVVSPGKARMIGRSAFSTATGMVQVGTELRQANEAAASTTGLNVSEQLRAIEERLEAVANARVQLISVVESIG